MTWQILSPVPIYFVQALVLVACLMVPGRYLLGVLLGAAWSTQPLYRKVGLAVLVSSLLLTAVESLAFVLPPSAMGVLVRLFALLAVGGGLALLKGRPSLQKPMESPHFLLMSVLGLLLLLALVFTWYAPMPGSVYAGLADIPAYYRVVENLSQGQEPLIDFRSGDFVGEIYFLPISYPIATLVAAFFKTLFPSNFHAYTTVNCLFGLFAVYFFAGFVCQGLRLKGPEGQLGWMTAVLLPLAFWQNWRFGNDLLLGASSLSAATFLLVFLDLGWNKPNLASRFRLPLLALCTVAAVLARPESLLFVALAFAVTVAAWILLWAAVGPTWRRAFVAGVTLAGLIFVWVAPLDKIPGKTPSFYYLHYSAEIDSFTYTPKTPKSDPTWQFVNHDNGLENLGLPRERTWLNERVFEEIRAEPVAFLRWLQRVLILRTPKSHWVFLAVLFFLLLRYGGVMGCQLVALTVIYMAALGSINPAFSPRHTLPLHTVLLAFALRASSDALRYRLLLPMRRFALSPGVAFALLTLLPATYCSWDIRVGERKSEYLILFEHLKDRVQPGELVATNYPQLASVMLNTPSVGNSTFAETLEVLIQREQPDWIVAEDFRYFQPRCYSKIRDLADGAWQKRHGYRLLYDTVGSGALIFQRMEEPGNGS